MLDAVLYAALGAIRALNYDQRTSDIRDDGRPPPRCGDVFVSVHQGPTRSTNDNCLMEYFGFFVTLTMRVTNVPLDRIGDRLLAIRKAQEVGFNRRAGQISNWLHMNWGALQDANNYIIEMSPDANEVYGFCEPWRFRSMELPTLVGGEWFTAMPEAQDVGLKAEMRFEDARRMQPEATFR